MTLTDTDYRDLAEQICEGEDVAIIDSDEHLEVHYDYEEEGYREDDFNCGYGNGTGAWVITAVYLDIRGWSCTDENDEETDCDFDEDKLYDYLKALRVG